MSAITDYAFPSVVGFVVIFLFKRYYGFGSSCTAGFFARKLGWFTLAIAAITVALKQDSEGFAVVLVLVAIWQMALALISWSCFTARYSGLTRIGEKLKLKPELTIMAFYTLITGLSAASYRLLYPAAGGLACLASAKGEFVALDPTGQGQGQPTGGCDSICEVEGTCGVDRVLSTVQWGLIVVVTVAGVVNGVFKLWKVPAIKLRDFKR